MKLLNKRPYIFALPLLGCPKGGALTRMTTPIISATMENDVLTVQEAADFLKLSPSTIYRHAKQKKLPARKIGGAWRFSRLALQNWLDTSEMQAESQQESNQ